MNYLLVNFVVALGLTTLTSLFIGFLVLIKGKTRTNKLFAIYSFGISWWSFWQALVITADTKSSAIIYETAEMVVVFFLPALFLHFIFSFLKIKGKSFIFYIVYLFSLILSVFCFSKYMFADTVPKFYLKYYPNPGIAYHCGVIFFFIIIFYCLRKLFEGYRTSSGARRTQLKYLFWSSLLGYIGGAANFSYTYDLNIPYLTPFGTYMVPLYVGLATYAILRHNLMDINIVIHKTAAYSVLVTIITAAYFILIYVIEGLFRGFVGYKSIPWTLSVIVLFTLIFQPLKNLIQNFIDKYFFKGSLLHEYEKAQEELKRAERLKAVGTLAAGMAHEIKNPLTGIKTFTEYLPSKGEDPEFRDKFYKIVSTEVNKINDIVQQLLSFSKPKLLKLEQTNIHTLLDQILSFLNNDLIKNNIKAIKDYDSTLPLFNIDPNQIKQVFLNLFLNSIDAMKQGGTITITTKLLDNTAEITIQDTGIGISKKDLEHIFDPFYTTKEAGTGLGMSIVYGIIKEHKGEISVESEIGEGTMFRVRFNA